MSRWFRHYAGMCRDDKLVRASIKSKQTIERVVWVWAAILESAAEIDDGGRYEVDHDEMARFLRCPASKLASIEDALVSLGRLTEGHVAKWSGRQFQSDRSADRTKRYRQRHKVGSDGENGSSRDDDVTSQERRCDSPETETKTETEVSVAKATGAPAPIDPEKVLFDQGIQFLGNHGVNEPKARQWIGKWRKDRHSPAEIIEAMGDAQRQGIINPTQWIEARWRSRKTREAVCDYPIA